MNRLRLVASGDSLLNYNVSVSGVVHYTHAAINLNVKYVWPISVPVLWRRFEDGFASIYILINSCKMPKDSETTGRNDGWKLWLAGNATNVSISDKWCSECPGFFVGTIGPLHQSAGMWSRSRGLGLETVSRANNVSSRSRLGQSAQRLGLGLFHVVGRDVLWACAQCGAV